jgi:hypothetical protein
MRFVAMADGVYYDRDVITLMGRERWARVITLGRHRQDDRGRRWWTWEELEECEGILNFEDGIGDEEGRQDATPDAPE